MSTMFLLNRDINGYPSTGTMTAASGDNFTAALTSGGGASSITVPDNEPQWIARFGYDPVSVVWVAKNTTATVPAGATLAANLSMQRPAEILVNAGDTISMLTSTATAYVSISLFAVSNQL